MGLQYKNIMVTGGSGFVGSHLVESLSKLAESVTVLDNKRQSNEGRLASRANVVVADIRDGRAMRKTLQGADIVFHLAGNSNTSRAVLDSDYDREVNAGGTLNVAEAALQTGVTRMVFVSTAAVYGRPESCPVAECGRTEPISPYGRSKLEAERICLGLHREFGLPVVIARPFCVYGEGEDPQNALCEVGRYLRWHVNGEAIQIVGDKIEKTRDFVSVSDCVAALILLAETGSLGTVYNIGSGREVSMEHLVELIEDATERAAVVREIGSVQEDTFRLVADVSRIERLGYRARTWIGQGIREMLANPSDLAVAPRNITIFRPGQVSETFPEPSPRSGVER